MKSGLVSWTPAADSVGMEAGHCIAVSSVDLGTIADVDIAWTPLMSAVLPRSIHDVAIKSNANWSESLSHSAHHVRRGCRQAVGEACTTLSSVSLLLS